MGNAAKTDNFLKAIKKYADEQRQSMHDEVEHLKEERLNEAKAKGKADSEKYISDMLEKKRNEETGKIAKLIQEGQQKLFSQRSEMTENVFKKAEKRLIDYTKTDEYTKGLVESAKAIAELFENENCVIMLRADDIDKVENIRSLFCTNAKFIADNSIKIGGIKGYCDKKRIVADDTLDSKLSEQRQWFVENSGLSVL